MFIHKEGFRIVFVSTVIFILLNFLCIAFVDMFLIQLAVVIVTLPLFLLVIWFFRAPKRNVELLGNSIYSPADGKVVVIEETMENEYFNDKMLQVSVFMSPLNVHINWYPIGGIVKYRQYHPGKYLVAWNPKSSLENERTTVVVKVSDNREILVRQIAGAVARRIVNYSKVDDNVAQGGQMGFIKFGSRVDILLPLDAKIKVNIGQKVKGIKTVLAEI